MKNLILFLCVLLKTQANCNTGSNMVVYNQKLYNTHPTKKFILLNGISDSIQFKAAFPSMQLLYFGTDELNNLVNSLNGSPNPNLQPTYAIVNSSLSINSLKTNSNLKYVTSYFEIEGDIIGYTHYFYVKVKNDCDSNYLKAKANQFGFYIEANYKFEKNWYVCRSDKNSYGDALALVDILLYDDRIEEAEPDLMNVYSTNCVNDTGFHNQWNLKNTGQFDTTLKYDIKICQAWDSTSGDSNIIVAVFDGGISKNHPDLTNLHSFSYNCMTGLPTPANSLTFPFSYAPHDFTHGTEVAGVIGASKNNTIGLSGVAPKCKIMDIAYDFSLSAPFQSLRIANGFDTAWRKGASVINCSWARNRTTDTIATDGLISSPIIEASIVRALTMGRGGKGCVIVFPTGNFKYLGFESIVLYPANFHPDIIAVGAMDVNAEIAIGFNGLVSHYGSEMDIIAPGTMLPVLNYNPSTSSNNILQNINGTSFSAPQVAGVAALILSKNPNLKQREVATIIEKTATKLPAYASFYATIPSRPNGTFYEKCGYGLLNAGSALASIIPPDPCPTAYENNLSYGMDRTIHSCNIEATNTQINGGITKYEFHNNLELHDGFEINNGIHTFEIITY